jgi:hypothetical protein
MITLSNSEYTTNIFMTSTNSESITLNLDYKKIFSVEPVIQLKFEDNLTDTSSNGNIHNAVLSDPGAYYTSGKDGQCISFINTNSKITVPYDSELSGSFTMTFWIKSDPTVAYDMGVLTKGKSFDGANPGFHINCRDYGGKWRYIIWYRANGSSTSKTLAYISSNEFIQLGIVYDHNNSTFAGYTNGRLIFSTPNATNNTNAAIVIGERLGNYANIMVDQFRYFTVPKNANDMYAQYQDDFSQIYPTPTNVPANAPDVGILSGPLGNITTNNAFDIVLTNNKPWGCWSTNSILWNYFYSTVSVQIVPETLYLAYYGFDGINTSPTNSNSYTWEYPPAVTSTLSSSYPIDTFFSYNLEVTDQDGDSVTITTNAVPGWLTYDPLLTNFSGFPGVSNIGSNFLSFTLFDGMYTVPVTQGFLVYDPASLIPISDVLEGLTAEKKNALDELQYTDSQLRSLTDDAISTPKIITANQNIAILATSFYNNKSKNTAIKNIQVYNVNGLAVKKLSVDGNNPSETDIFIWDGTSVQQTPSHTGVYIVKVIAEINNQDVEKSCILLITN